ncbi:transposase domain-containing protein, partial [Halomonas sp. AOP42-C1-46]|uniref:transposase domain-containing protein n=1 Tax=Halomonas sp. AOP42-C1-46 TaxID=3457671 RepID=UPI0040335CAF
MSAMNSTASAPSSNAPSYLALAEENAVLREQLGAQAEAIRQLTHQLDWFKKQLFGPKSEKQVFDLPGQDSLFQP